MSESESSGASQDAAALYDLLAWHKAMGVDVAIEELGVDRLSLRPSTPPPVAAIEPERAIDSAVPVVAERPSPVMAAAPVAETERIAREVASAATTLDELRDVLSRFEGCNLRHTATNLVFSDGTPGSRVMFVGEAPGRDEDLSGLPFVGRAGQLLDQMLKAIGLSRQDVYIANIVPWRPPGNRTPTPQETAACRPFITRQIELAAPDILVCLGNVPMHELLQTGDGILKMRGRWRSYDTGSRTIRAMAMLHPAYLLRQPLQKRLAWRDLLSLRAELDKVEG